MLCSIIDRECKSLMITCKTIGNCKDDVKRVYMPCVLGELLLRSRVLLLCRNVNPVLPRSSNFSRNARNPYLNIKVPLFKHVCSSKFFGCQSVVPDLNEPAALRKWKETKGRPILARKSRGGKESQKDGSQIPPTSQSGLGSPNLSAF